MLECGHYYNRWIEYALEYLPQEIFDEHKENLVFISTAETDACRVARHYCEKREVIVLSERILPKYGADEEQPAVRYFIYVVLHEVAHAIKKHKSPIFDSLTQDEKISQEDEADKLAFQWFNQHIEKISDPSLIAITKEEIEKEKQRNQEIMKNLFIGC